MSKKQRWIRENPDRHAGIKMNRESEYPVEISTRAGASVFLNPLKRMIKGKPYKNQEFQNETNRMIKEAVQRNAAIAKQREEEQKKIDSGQVTYEVKE